MSQSTGSQFTNLELTITRFAELLRAILTPVSIRRKTRVSKGAKLRRLEEKKQRSRLKHGRSKSSLDD